MAFFIFYSYTALIEHKGKADFLGFGVNNLICMSCACTYFVLLYFLKNQGRILKKALIAIVHNKTVKYVNFSIETAC